MFDYGCSGGRSGIDESGIEDGGILEEDALECKNVLMEKRTGVIFQPSMYVYNIHRAEIVGFQARSLTQDPRLVVPKPALM